MAVQRVAFGLCLALSCTVVRAGDDIPAAVRDGSGPRLHWCRLEGEPQSALSRLARVGVVPLLAAPPDAWLVRAAPETAKKAMELDVVAEMRVLTPTERIAPPLRDVLVGPKPSGELRLWVALAPGASLSGWKEKLRAVEGVRILGLHESEVQPLATLAVQAAALGPAVEQLARLEETRVVDLARAPGPQMEDAIWALQTGELGVRAADYGVSAKLFAAGITGRGMLLGHLDEGLENDYCPEVYRSGPPEEAAWPIGPGADAANPVPPEESLASTGQAAPVRTRERKVVAYLVQPGPCAPYSSPLQHGTLCDGIAVGDDPGVLAARPLVRDLGEAQDVRPFRAGGSWTLGQELRPDLAGSLDDPAAHDPQFASDHGPNVQHHQAGDGIAPGAQVVFQDLGDAEGIMDTTASPEALLRQASRMGATTWLAPLAWPCTSCTDCYDTVSTAVDAVSWARRDLVVVVPAGNFGPGPGTTSAGLAQSKSAVVVGGSEHPASASCEPGTCPQWSTSLPGEDMLSYSGCGPSSDGRLAPTIVAPGVVQAAAEIQQVPAADPEDGSGSGDVSCARSARPSGGTSIACSVVAGASLLVQQYFWDGYYPSGAPTLRHALRPTNALVRAVLVNSARDVLGSRTDTGNGQQHRPSMRQGFGSPVLDDSLFLAGDPRGSSDRRTIERSRLLVLNDAPNGIDGRFPLAPEPGGLTRDGILASYRPALSAGQVHEFIVGVLPPVRGEDLRLTLAWSDPPAGDRHGRVVNDLDLEVVSPGPDGILQSSQGAEVLGDDVLYRPGHEGWAGGATMPAAATTLLDPALPPSTAPGRDAVNTVECVFVPAGQVREGAWRVRVVASAIRGTGLNREATPNFALGDRPPTRDTSGDGVPDEDETDFIPSNRQGYALVATGPVAMPAPPRFEPPVHARPPRAPRVEGGRIGG